MSEPKFYISDMRDHLELCREFGIKSFELDGVKVEFFPPTPEPMKLDPKSLTEAFADNMPPDSAMLFASSEDMPNIDNPIPQTRGTDADA